MAMRGQSGNAEIEVLRRAVAAFNAGRSDEAQRLCAAGLRAAPRDPALNHLLATISLARGELAAAETAILTALKGQVGTLPRHLLAARILGAGNNLPAALWHCEQALVLGRTPEALLEHARLLTALRDERAIGAWRAVIAADPGSAEAKARLGRLLWEGGEIAEAVRWLTDAANAQAPASVWFDLATAREDLKDRKSAIAAYRKALSIRPDFAEAAVNLAIQLQEEGDMDAAMVAYGTAYKQKPATLGMIAMALTSAQTGRLWLDREALRHSLGE
ncbi:tetratricopeptide repeat protein [Labrys okinawensis]|uniref:tetratricopeptide repeat protein n=1 Tax=Labrys okinawensis TaxID=346911 RepID=UPI0039BC9D31